MDDTNRDRLNRIDTRITTFRARRLAADDAAHDLEYEVAEAEIDRLLELRLIISRGSLLTPQLRLEVDAL